MADFPDVTLLITHYNRSSSLERLLKAFEDLQCHFGEVVVSDDCSKTEHLELIEKLKERFQFTLITTPVNKGLGNNINKGQDAVKTPYTLYVQEDFVPNHIFPLHFQEALDYMNERSELDMVRFYAYFKYPNLVPVGKGFSEMEFKLINPGYRKFYFYSDHPHLRRSTFFQKFGRYQEGIKMDRTEYNMMMSVIKRKGKALFFDDYTSLFDQRNSKDEPSTVHRNKWSESPNLIVTGLRHLYRHLKFNYNYLR